MTKLLIDITVLTYSERVHWIWKLQEENIKWRKFNTKITDFESLKLNVQ
jgi:hypothetical protein